MFKRACGKGHFVSAVRSAATKLLYSRVPSVLGTLPMFVQRLQRLLVKTSDSWQRLQLAVPSYLTLSSHAGAAKGFVIMAYRAASPPLGFCRLARMTALRLCVANSLACARNDNLPSPDRCKANTHNNRCYSDFHLLPQRKLHLRRMQRRRQQMSLQLPPPLRQSSLRPAP